MTWLKSEQVRQRLTPSSKRKAAISTSSRSTYVDPHADAVQMPAQLCTPVSSAATATGTTQKQSHLQRAFDRVRRGRSTSLSSHSSSSLFMFPSANVSKQFLEAPLHAPPGQVQLSDIHRKMGPSDEVVNLFLEFTAAGDRALAVKFLEGNNNDVEAAVADYFNDGTKYDNVNSAWDESQFHTDREGSNTTQNIPSFSIDCGEDSGIYGVASSAPTRPPSRRSNHSAQETGTINTHGQDGGGRKYFGPLTRDASSYVDADWALVPTTSSWRLYTNPEAVDRRRDLNNREPVLLKPLPESDPLPSLLTILAHIPLARKELLYPSFDAGDYRTSPEWWDGKSLDDAQVRDLDESDLDTSRDIIAETQRVIAFLTGSTRSYGSAEVLHQLHGLSETATRAILRKDGAFTGDLRFLVGWSTAAEIFNSSLDYSFDIFKTTSAMIENTASGPQETINPFYRLELNLSASTPKQSLYQAVDSMIWMADPNGRDDDTYCLDDIAPVLVMRVTNKDTTKNAHGLGMNVPMSCYVDRYLKNNMLATKQMRRDRAELKESLTTLAERRQKFMNVKHCADNTKTVDAKVLFDKTIEYLKRKVKAESPKDGEDESVEESEHQILADQLAEYYAKMQMRLAELDSERQSIEAKIEHMSSILTDPETAQSEDLIPQHRYTLRGVGIGPDWEVTYIYVDPDASTTDGDAMQADGQWWKLSFANNSLSKTAVAEETVLKETSGDTKEALLVYASVPATDLREPLPEVSEGLKAWVEWDNGLFAKELAEAEEGVARAQRVWEGVEDRPPPYDEAWVEDSIALGAEAEEEEEEEDKVVEIDGSSPGGVAATTTGMVWDDRVDEYGRKNGSYMPW